MPRKTYRQTSYYTSYYKPHQILKLKCFSYRLAVVFVQSIEASCEVENEDAVGAATSIFSIFDWAPLVGYPNNG